MTVIQIPLRCERMIETEGDPVRCQSRNAVWCERHQMNLCSACEAGLTRAKLRHPSNRSKQP